MEAGRRVCVFYDHGRRAWAEAAEEVEGKEEGGGGEEEDAA